MSRPKKSEHRILSAAFIVAAARAAIVAIPALLSTRAALATPPNVVLIVTDDQRWDTIFNRHGINGANVMPQVIAQLVNSGVQFTNAYTTTPICSPSRSSILTGQYAHNHGVRGNLSPIGGALVFDDTATLATALDQGGYRTGLYGKYLNEYHLKWTSPQPPYEPPGWDEWHAFRIAAYYNYTLVENGVEVPFGQATADYSTDVIKNKAVTFIQSSVSQGSPFFLYFAPYAPHLPYTPAPRHVGSYTNVPAFRPPNYNEPDTTDKPQWLRNRPPLTISERLQLDTDRRNYLASLQAVDDAVGSIMQTLTSLGVAQNTMVIFVGDHSYFWGEHRIDGKGTMYEENVRVPLIIRYPPLAPTARVESRVALNVDLPATILAVTGIAPPHPPDGVSLVPLITGASVPWRTDFLTEGWEAEAVPTQPYWAGVHSGNWVYNELRTGEIELYDLVTDPYQLSNQANNPANEGLINSLAATLRGYRPGWPADVGCVDADADGYAPAGGAQCRSHTDDCDDTNSQAWAKPGEALALTFEGTPGLDTLDWTMPLTIGSPPAAIQFDTLRSDLPGDFSTLTCVESAAGPDTTAADPALPADGSVFFYLIRARNGCPSGTGPLGLASNGTPRTAPACP